VSVSSGSKGSAFLKTLRLPGLTIPGNLFLAPLAGYSDAAFRSICLLWGADLCYTEMVSAEGIVRDNGTTFELLRRADNEKLFAVQIFAAGERSAALAVRKLEGLKPDLYDLNCGCAVPKVVRSGCGAALLRSPESIAAIVSAMRSETASPVTVKLRSGWDGQSVNYLQCAGAAERAGAAMICLHPRTRAQGFSGRARISELKSLKSHCDVPVIGSGDLFSPEDAEGVLRQTACDGLMFARGALGNPFIFAATKAHLSGRRGYAPPGVRQRLETALQQLQAAAEFKGEPRACRDMRKHFCYYTKGIPTGAELRSRVVRAERIQSYESLVAHFLSQKGFM
jgi:tRNA-dihydrouridine synthase B